MPVSALRCTSAGEPSLRGFGELDLLVVGEPLPVPGLGPVTTRILREPSVPTLVTRRLPDVNAPRRILCPVGLGAASEASLAWAAAIARASSATLLLLHVLEWFPDEPASEAELGEPDSQTDLAATARARLALLARDTGCKARAHVATGTPHRQILRVAREQAADLISLGAHTRRDLDRILPGTTSCRVLSLAECAVLRVPAGRGGEPYVDPDCSWR